MPAREQPSTWLISRREINREMFWLPGLPFKKPVHRRQGAVIFLHGQGTEKQGTGSISIMVQPRPYARQFSLIRMCCLPVREAYVQFRFDEPVAVRRK